MLYSKSLILLWGESTKQKQSITSIFKESRFYYFKKHFGLLPALVVEVVTRFGKVHALITGVILLSLVLSFIVFPKPCISSETRGGFIYLPGIC